MKVDSARFAQFYEEGYPRTIRFLLSLGFPRDEAVEVAQSSWAMAWERLEQLRDDSKIFSWVNTIALNAARKSLRRFKQDAALRPDENECLTTLNVAAIDVNAIFNSLLPRDRSLLEAHLAGMSIGELATAHGTSLVAMRLRSFRARKAARELCKPVADENEVTGRHLSSLTRKFHDQCLVFAQQYVKNAETLLDLLDMTPDEQKREKLYKAIRKSIGHGMKSLSHVPVARPEVPTYRSALMELKLRLSEITRSVDTGTQSAA